MNSLASSKADDSIKTGASLRPAIGAVETARAFSSLIKFEHTIFSLPFALLGMALAADGFPRIQTVALILLALVAARTAAMSFNRLVDKHFDRENPRTAERELVTGKLSDAKVWALTTVSSFVFVAAAFGLNPLCGYLSFPTLAVILGYSFTKRFTALSHLVLGLALGISPGAAWLAVGAPVTWTPVALGLIVLTWVAGFDVLYSLADITVDQRAGLHSIPQSVGLTRAITISRLLHAVCALLMITLFVQLQFPFWALLALAPTYALFARQHKIVSAKDLSRLNVAFFTVNGWLGVIFCVTTAALYFLI